MTTLLEFAGEAVFFDVGGTLYQSPQLDVEHNEAVAQLIARARGLPIERAKALLKEARIRRPARVDAAAALGFTKSQVHSAFETVNPGSFLKSNPEVGNSLRRLRASFRLGLLSNFRRQHIERILRAIGVDGELFSWWITADVVKEAKPASEPFLLALERASVPADQCLYVGDSPSKDMVPAKRCGFRTVLVRKNPSQCDLAAADYAVDGVNQLVDALLAQ